MNWDTIQQLLRIVLYSLGAYLFGDSTANGELFQGLIGGAISIGAFAWWWFWERDRAPTVPPLPPASTTRTFP